LHWAEYNEGMSEQETRPGRPCNIELDATVKALAEHGSTRAEIRAVLGLTANQAQYRITRQGLKCTPMKGGPKGPTGPQKLNLHRRWADMRVAGMKIKQIADKEGVWPQTVYYALAAYRKWLDAQVAKQVAPQGAEKGVVA
jgi:hypothetical protein